MEQNEVLEFIQRRFPDDCHWLDGNCYYFAAILKLRFPGAVIWYDVIYGHFFVNIDGEDYDWTGIIQRKSDGWCVEWEKMKEYDSNVQERIVRDCIM